MSGAPARRRGGGRAARREMRSTSSSSAAAFLTRKIAPFEIVSDEGLELLEHNAETILETVGVEIRDHPGAVERFRDAGADVDGT
ncbi:MAG: trimethylamine methyltransferase family protein, partial [Actinomycetota bacterium]